MTQTKYLIIQETNLLEAELFIARLRKWMVCLVVVIGFLFIRVDSLSPIQGLFAVASVYYSFQVEAYYRYAGMRGLKHLSAVLDFVMIWGYLAFCSGFEYQCLALFVITGLGTLPNNLLELGTQKYLATQP